MALGEITGLVAGILEGSTGLVLHAMQINTILGIGIVFGLILIAYKIFHLVIRAIITGFLASFIPAAALVLGIDIGIPLTLNNMIWFGVLGISTYLVYASVSMGAKTVRLLMKPLNFLFKNKPKEKIIIKEIKKEED